MNGRHEPAPDQPALRRAEAEVARHLEEACDEVDRENLSQESLDELIHLEDELLAAVRAVEETVRLRRQRGDRPATDRPSRGSSGDAAPAKPAEPEYRLREFTGADAIEWRVWETRPGSSGRAINPERYLGEYVTGWLTFESVRDAIRKRLPNHPTDWFHMSDADLVRLLLRAVEVPKRNVKARDAATP